jgi:hypothetical protein
VFSLRDYPESVGLLDLPGWQKTPQASAIGYSVAPTDDKRTMWTAQQTLELRGSEGPALRRKAHDKATTGALKELQARAASAAALSRDGHGGPGDAGATGDGRTRRRHGGGVSRLHLAALKETSGGREWSRRKGRSFAPTHRTTGVNLAGGRPCLFLSPPHP